MLRSSARLTRRLGANHVCPFCISARRQGPASQALSTLIQRLHSSITTHADDCSVAETWHHSPAREIGEYQGRNQGRVILQNGSGTSQELQKRPEPDPESKSEIVTNPPASPSIDPAGSRVRGPDSEQSTHEPEIPVEGARPRPADSKTRQEVHVPRICGEEPLGRYLAPRSVEMPDLSVLSFRKYEPESSIFLNYHPLASMSTRPGTPGDRSARSRLADQKKKIMFKKGTTKSGMTPAESRRAARKQWEALARPDTPGDGSVLSHLAEQEGKIASGKRATESGSTPAKSRRAARKQREALACSPTPEITTISASGLDLEPVNQAPLDLPSLSYGLDRVLFNPGVYVLQDPRSRVYNFDPYVSQIMPIQEFDFRALKEYVTSSQDANLKAIARVHDKKYAGSTSSMTSVLSHFHYLLSAWRPINPDRMTKEYQLDTLNFVQSSRIPAAVVLHWRDGAYTIDADQEFDTINILSMLGRSLEKLFTLPKEGYEKFRRSNSDQLANKDREAAEAHHFTGFGDFLMRSQLDARDARLPGTGVFDLKTRAVLPIRMDPYDYHKGLGYEIRERFGRFESFESEYFDMIRSAFLKYSLQARMGRMDGVLVAFHNIQRIFGFQYVSLDEMDRTLHGPQYPRIGDQEFKLSMRLWNDILDRATKRFPERSLRMYFETRESKSPKAAFMYIFARPVVPGEIEEIRANNAAEIEAFGHKVLGFEKDTAKTELSAEPDNAANEDDLEQYEPPAPAQTDSAVSWKELRSLVENAVDNDEHGIVPIKEAIDEALEQAAGDPRETTQKRRKKERNNDTETQPRMVKLKDFIVRATQLIDETSTREAGQGEFAAQDDHSKLRELKRMLSNLTSCSERDVAEQKMAIPSKPDEQDLSQTGDGPSGLDSEASEHAALASQADKIEDKAAAAGTEQDPELLGMVLTIRNKVDGEYVERPSSLGETTRWTLEYNIEELPPSRAATIHQQVQNRRRPKFMAPEHRAASWHRMFQGKLPDRTEAGRGFRKSETARARTRPVHVVGQSEPLRYEDVFGSGEE